VEEAMSGVAEVLDQRQEALDRGNGRRYEKARIRQAVARGEETIENVIRSEALRTMWTIELLAMQPWVGFKRARAVARKAEVSDKLVGELTERQMNELVRLNAELLATRVVRPVQTASYKSRHEALLRVA
jgi:hypothetical protein